MALLSKDYIPGTHELKLSCTTLCYSEMDKQTVPFGKVAFPHDENVLSNQMECKACHSSRKDHGKIYLKNCSDCHHGASLGQVKCQDCHAMAANLFYGRGGLGVEETPSLKAGIIECADCHLATRQGKRSTVKNIRSSCIDCHEQSYGKTLDSWIATGNGLLSHTASKIEKVRRTMERMQRMGKKIYVPYKNMFDEADRNFNLVKQGKAIHNLAYSEALITRANKKIG